MIEKIEEITYNDVVYDLNIQDNHNYFVEDVLVHNCHAKVIEGLFGPVKKVITTKELMDRKQVSDFKIKCLVLKHDEESCKVCKKLKYQDEIKFLITNQKRNKFIRNLALSLNTNTLILYNYVDSHGKVLYEIIKNNKNIGDRKVFFVHGGISADERENIRKTVEEENNYIELDFEGNKLNLPISEDVPLSDGTIKKANQITVDDDILNSWIKQKFKKDKK